MEVTDLRDAVNARARQQPFSQYEAPVQLQYLNRILEGNITPTSRTVTRLLRALGYEPGTPIADFVMQASQQELLTKHPTRAQKD
jgi:hypothetical protein